MTNNLKEFMKKAAEDKELFSKLEALNQEQDNDVIIKKTIEIANKANFTLTPADFKASEEELDDEELNAVAGGWKKCVCIAGGGGKEDSDGNTCGCVAAGLGTRKDNGDLLRCLCYAVGYGKDDKLDMSATGV